jgi:hypothetical protein
MTGTEVQQLEIALVFATVYVGMILGGLPHASSWIARGGLAWAPLR